jgi:SAM-dependent methyltransferase
MATCGICSGPLTLRRRGAATAPTATDFAPSCHATGGHGDLYACTRCGTVQQPGLPDGPELHELYRDMRDDAYLEEEAGRRATSRRLLDAIERHAPRGSMLEVGCGHGLLLDEARARGWQVAGLELSTASLEHARERLGLDVRAETLEALDPAADGGRQAVVLVDVLEHLDDPVGALAQCASLLAPGGVLCVVTPDPASRTARLAGARWWAYLPSHTYLVPHATLRRLLGDAGLETVEERGLRRSFSLGYWVAGLGERSGPLRRVLAAMRRLKLAQRRVTLSLGDERIVVARR